MKKPSRIIEILNDVLTAELTAINQYFVHGEMCEDWGYERLHGIIRKQSIGEMKHAEKLIERILYLKGVPNVQRMGKILIGETVPEQIKVDLALEKEALVRLSKGIAVCREEGDHGSADLLEEILKSEEEHVHFLEAQQALIEQVGVQNYLSQQIHKTE